MSLKPPVAPNDSAPSIVDGFDTRLDLVESGGGPAKLGINNAFVGDIGIGRAVDSGTNLAIGAGTSTLPVRDNTGLTCFIDAGANVPSAAMVSLRIPTGTVEGQTCQALIARVEVEDLAGESTQDTVALWADAQVKSDSDRPVWGANIYVDIDSAVTGYTASAVAAEFLIVNDGDTDNGGGVVHIGSRGASSVWYGLYIGNGSSSAVANQIEHALIIPSGVTATPLSSLVAPLTNAIHYGPVPVEDSNPFFQVNRNGLMTVGGNYDLDELGTVFRVLAADQTVPTIEANTGGRILLGNGVDPLDVTLRRTSGPSLVVQPSVTINTAAAQSGGYIQLFEPSGVPASPAADGIRIYAKDVGGLTKLFFKDSAGTEFQVGTV